MHDQVQLTTTVLRLSAIQKLVPCTTRYCCVPLVSDIQQMHDQAGTDAWVWCYELGYWRAWAGTE
eukprot:20035-Rhodomonas_salina.2